MERESILKLPAHEPPVLCADGKMGMLTVFPGNEDRCGVQVHGELEHRWMTSADLDGSKDGALRQRGAPAMPTKSDDLVQLMLAMHWVELGGRGIKDDGVEAQAKK